MTLLRIAAFEVHQRLRMISTYAYFAIFFVLGAFWMVLAAGGIPTASVDFGAGGKVLANAPYSVVVLVMLVAFFGTVITAAMAGRATFQDVEHRTTSLFFTAPITKLDYLGGRYLGALASMLLVLPGISIGAWVASHLPLVDATRNGPEIPFANVAPYMTIVLPNLILTSGDLLPALRDAHEANAPRLRRGRRPRPRLPHRRGHHVEHRKPDARCDRRSVRHERRRSRRRILDDRREEHARHPVHRPRSLEPPSLDGGGHRVSGVRVRAVLVRGGRALGGGQERRRSRRDACAIQAPSACTDVRFLTPRVVLGAPRADPPAVQRDGEERLLPRHRLGGRSLRGRDGAPEKSIKLLSGPKTPTTR